MKNFLYSILIALNLGAVAFGDVISDLFLFAAVKSGAVKSFAKIKWGAIVVDGRGKLGGHVFSKNRSGAYIRTKVTPGNPQTITQSAVRNSFTTNSQAWRGLTAAQRSSWRAAVSNFVDTNIFGDSKTLSGFQLYMRINNYLLLIGSAVLTVPPLPSAVPAFLTASAVVSTGGGTMIITYTGAIAATESCIISATPALSAGKDFVKSEYRNIMIAETGVPDQSPLDIFTDWSAVFGTIPALGTKVFIKMQQVTKTTGLPGAVIFMSTITVA